jgi:hypothetical protein
MIADSWMAIIFCFGFPMANSAGKRAALQNLWEVYREIFAHRGVDIAEQSAKWAEQKRQSLEEHGATGSFDHLCKHRCAKLPLAIAVGIVQPLRSSGKKWGKIMGATRQRDQKIRALEKAANVLEDLLGLVADELIVDTDGLMDTESRKALRKELVSPRENALKSATNIYVPDPAITINALRTYASILKNTTASPDMFAKYLISAYVYRATGGFHDVEVSSLLGAAMGVFYDETAHRMWRNRNYRRLDKSLGSVADLLIDFGKVSVS